MLPVHLNSTTVAVDLPASDFFIKDGRKINVGDCALFKPPQDSLPFIGIIYKLKAGKENSLSLVVNWLYRPADIKLVKGISVEAAPNEVFYSFRKDEIPASSLLHPCRVAFLHKGVELPSGISSFVCRRGYDIDDKCLWWLTDKNYINERKEEVDKLLDRTRLEMHAVVQSEGRSPKSLNGPTLSPPSKSGSDSVQNSSSFSSQVKGKKRDRVDQGSEIAKREHLTKTENGDSDQNRTENMLKFEIAKITDRGGLVDFEGVEKLVKLMQPDSADKKIDLAGRVMLVDVIAVTDRLDCLGWFLQLRGLPVLDEWLQEVHKGKIGYGSSPKESDKSVEEFLFALLRALDKLPVNLNALQTCNVGKSVNHLRTHKNSEIQRKARVLVDTWKRRVEDEMNMNDGKSGSRHGVSWPTKSLSTEASHISNRKAGGSNEVVMKSSTAQPPGSKNPQVKLGTTEAVVKSSLSPGANKPTASCGISSKCHNLRVLVSTGNSDLPLPPIKEERSSSSSQSQNNSQSSDHAKTLGSSCREDARSSSAGSGSVTKVSTGGTRHRKSSNGIQGTAVSGVQTETVSRKVNASNRKLTAETTATDGASYEKSSDLPHVDYGNGRLIVKLPNSSCSPARVSIGGSENPMILRGRALPAEKPGNHDKRVKGSNDALEANTACNSKDRLVVPEEGNKLSPGDEQDRAGEEGEMPMELSKAKISLAGTFTGSGKPYGASLSSMNALVESCIKFSENGASTSPGDDGMNLLASVAAGVSKSDNVSPLHSPGGNSPIAEESSSAGNSGRLKQLGEEAATQCQAHGGASCTASEQVSGDLLQSRNESRFPITHTSVNSDDDRKGLITASERPRDSSVKLKSSLDLQQNVDSPSFGSDGKPGEVTYGSTAVLASSDAGKEGNIEAEGAKQFPDQELKKSRHHKIKNSWISDSESKGTTSLHEEVKKVDYANERVLDNRVAVGLEATAISTMAEKDLNENSACLSSEVDVEKQNTSKESSIGIVMEKKPSVVTESHSNSIEEKREDVVLLPCSANPLDVESKAKKVDDVKTESHDEPSQRKTMTLDAIAPNKKNHYAEENLEGKVGIVLCSGAPIPHVVPPSIPVKENGQSEKSSGCKVDRIGSEVTEEKVVSNVYLPPAAGSDSAVKLDFDLNEGFPVDDGSQGEFARAADPGTSSAIQLPCQLPFSISSMSGSYSASITVASAAKGPVVPPENPTRAGAEHGWKGSAATSAFRPAEPRKNLEMPLRTSDSPVLNNITNSRECRSPLDFDLNVPDQRVLDDLALRSTVQTAHAESKPRYGGAGGLDLDLNRLDESSDVGPLSNGLVNFSRDFDLNNGPCLDDVSSETSISQQNKCPMPLPFVPGTRANPMEFGNISPWFSSGNSYSAMAPIPSVFPGRGNQSYVAAAGSQRFLAPTGTSSFAPEIYRGSISSSHAVAFSPSTTFQFPGFPFETNFPLSSNCFSGSSTAYMDSSAGGALCFPTIPSRLIGPAGVVPSPFPRPYIMSVPGATNGDPDGRKWGFQGLDLNAGPLGTDTERREDRLSSGMRPISIPSLQPVVNEQLNMYQVGGVLKRKEPDSGLEAADRFSYNKHSWQ